MLNGHYQINIMITINLGVNYLRINDDMVPLKKSGQGVLAAFLLLY